MAFPGFINEFNTSPISVTFSSYLGLDVTEPTTQLYWPFQAPEQPTPFSEVIQIISNSSNTNAILLPDATVTTCGQTTIIINTSGVDIYLKDFDGFTVGTISDSGDPIANSYYLTLTDNTRTDGVWLLAAFGTAASPPSVNSLVDQGTDTDGRLLNGGLAAIVDTGTAPGTYLKVNTLTSEYDATIDGSYAQSQGDRGTLLIWTDGTEDYLLMAAADAGNGFQFSINNASAGAQITFVPDGGDTIDIASMTPGTSATFISDGVSSWTSLGYGLNTVPSTFTNVIVYLQDGSEGAPSLAFNNDQTLGLFRNTTTNPSLQIVQANTVLADFEKNSTYAAGRVNIPALVFQQSSISLSSIMRAYS